MKKALWFLWIWLFALTVCIPVSAVTSAPKMEDKTEFRSDGSCRVSITLRLHLQEDEPVWYPLPAEATQIQIGGAQAQTKQEDGQLLLALPVSGPGDYTFGFHYELPAPFVRGKKDCLVTLPLLNGFRYPIEAWESTITFPAEITAQPVLESGYHQQNVEDLLNCTISGSTIHLSGKTTLVDRETLVLTVSLPRDFFQDAPRVLPKLDTWDLVVTLLMVGCTLYYLLALMPKWVGRSRCFTPPEGITAGDVGTCLTGRGTDLTMLVLTWAQMGYISLELEGRRLTLHKRMEMGNERGSHEIRWFKSLFGQRSMIDADSYHYAKLCRKLAAKSPIRGQLYDKRSGSPDLFRILCSITAIVAGLQMGLSMGNSVGTKTLLGLTFACLCCAFSYFIQAGGKCLPLRDKLPLWTGVGCGLAWIGLGALAGELHQVLPMVCFQFLAGIAAAYGGKRSELGLRYLREIRSLRRHMVADSTFELQQFLQKNPNYYYELAPYALAMGVDRRFARRFGRMGLPEENCLQWGAAREMTASQYAARLRKAADLLNQRQRRLAYEQFKGKT